MTSGKTIFNVRIYREMRLYYSGIKASSHEQAARLCSLTGSGGVRVIHSHGGGVVIVRRSRSSVRRRPKRAA